VRPLAEQSPEEQSPEKPSQAQSKSAGLQPQTELSADRTAILWLAFWLAVAFLAVVFLAVTGSRGFVPAAVQVTVPSQRPCVDSILDCLVTRSWLPPF